MKRKLNTVFCIILALLLCFGMGLSAFAVNDSVSVKIKASVVCSGGVPETKEKYVLKLKSLDNGSELFTEIDGEGECEFPELSFNEVGIYKYTVTQVKGNNKDCTYDGTVYYLTITVFHGENIYDFDIAAKVLKDGVDEKQDAVVFGNVYKEIEQPTEEPTEEPTEKPAEKPTKPEEKTTEKVTEKAAEDNSDTPYTGDTNSLSMWFGLTAIGFVFIVSALIVLTPKKKYSDEQDL